MSDVLDSNPSAPALTQADLRRVLQVLDIAARRGAFAAEEFLEIGSLYSKVTIFLERQGHVQIAVPGLSSSLGNAGDGTRP